MTHSLTSRDHEGHDTGRRAYPKGYSDADLDVIRQHAGALSDGVVGEMLGFSAHKVYTIRKANGIAPVSRKRRPQTIIDTVRREYVEAGRPANDVGAELGITATSVRRIAYQHKMGRPRRHAVANAGAAVRRLLAANPRPKKERPAKPPKVESRLLSADYAALVADFMARKAVTIVPPGQAAGITQWEMLLGTAPPPGSSWRDEQARGLASVAQKRRAEAGRAAA